MNTGGNRNIRILIGERLLHNYSLDEISFKLPEPSHFIDIGGNIGLVSIGARLLWSKTSIHALEPDADAYTCMCCNVDGMRIDAHQIALGKSGVAHQQRRGTLIARRYGVKDSLTKLEDNDILSLPLSQIAVRCGVVPETTVWKIDCEGGESCLLQDKAGSDILGKAQAVVAELHYDILSQQTGCTYEEAHERWVAWMNQTFPGDRFDVRYTGRHCIVLVAIRKPQEATGGKLVAAPGEWVSLAKEPV